MGSKVEACAECSKKCLLIHGKKKKDPSPIVTSFFKVIVADQFLKVLFLPPKIACMLSSLDDQKTYLEDSNGHRWRVKLSNLNDSLAFQQGWHDFASDHNLEIGDFVVFNYIMESHFVVQIYSRNGCEKLNFLEEKNSSGRSIRNKLSSGNVLSDGINSNATDDLCHMVDKGSMNKQGSSSTVPSVSDIEIIESPCHAKDVKKVPMATENTSRCDNSFKRPHPVSTADYTEVPYYMIDRDAGYTQGEFRTSLFDLSNFEMFESKSHGSNGANKVPMTIEKEKSPYHANKSLPSQTTLEAGITDKDRVADEGTNRVVPSDVSDFGRCNAEDMEKVSIATETDSCYIKTSRHSQTASKVDFRENKKGTQEMPNGAIGKCTLTEKGNDGCSGKERKVVKKKHDKIIQEGHGKEPKVIKVEHKKRFNPRIKEEEKAYKVVKTEHVDSIGLSSPNSVNFCCSVPTVTQSWLELPTGGLSSSSCLGGMRMERKVVLLRDPATRLWPVLYHETPGFRVLTSGWKALCKANKIQEGDVCKFAVESESEGVFRVGISKR